MHDAMRVINNGHAGTFMSITHIRFLTQAMGLESTDMGMGMGGDSHAKNPSSSSRRLGAGSGAPGPSSFGSLTYPPSPNGFSACSLERIGVEEEVLTGRSGSRRAHPRLFIESRKEVDAMSGSADGGKVHLRADTRD